MIKNLTGTKFHDSVIANNDDYDGVDEEEDDSIKNNDCNNCDDDIIIDVVHVDHDDDDSDKNARTVFSCAVETLTLHLIIEEQLKSL